MAEYIEREAAIERLKRRRDSERFPKTKYAGLESAIFQIKHVPAADVVEVVRCKDCKCRYVPTRCALWYATVDDKEYFVERGDDFYCSYGEAKMDGKGE